MPTRRLAACSDADTALEGWIAGVTLVEFAIVLPIFVTSLFAMIEFGVAFNAVLSINRASQAAALIAGQAGNDTSADCVILNRIEENLQAPDRQEQRAAGQDLPRQLDRFDDRSPRTPTPAAARWTAARHRALHGDLDAATRKPALQRPRPAAQR